MKVSKLLGETMKQAPADCNIESQKIMVRGGYIKHMHNGIYSMFMPTKTITSKIEKIIREEMNAVDGQEVMFPVVMPASLWRESGRYDSIGKEMGRFKDRSNNDMVLGMTHEEAAVHLARNTAKSYQQYPFMIYQIQTKFRDEPRCRGGLIRVREFTMKDAYSFHTSQEDLEEYYMKVLEAYNRIFKRCGARNFIVVKSDSGMMGGKVAHEFMLITDIGEDALVICPECGYQANMECATVRVENENRGVKELTKVNTPNVKTIEELKSFLKVDEKNMVKAVVYQKNEDDSYVVVFIRGDLEVNDTKLRNAIKAEIHEGVITQESGITAGFIGPVGFDAKATVVYDSSIVGMTDAVCGANESDYHYTGLDIARDLGDITTVDVAKIKEGFYCPECGKPSITLKNGIEIGNIFQLGKKYTESMGMTFVDKDGKENNPIMGCYGIGVGRLAASICEESHDDYGPIWPMSIAPWQVEICNLRTDNEEVNRVANDLYEGLMKDKIEVLYDDRNIRPGAMFADADLFGVPVRVIVSPKNMEEGVVELVYRDKSVNEKIKISDAKETIKAHVAKLLAQYDI